MFRKIFSLCTLILGALFCLTPWGSSAAALFLGVIVSVFVGNLFVEKTKLISQKLLSYSIIGLGAGMDLIQVGKAGLGGMSYTLISIAMTFFTGFLLAKLFKSDQETSLLISTGTAICGGSAIMAVAPTINARNQSITVALATVFLLNSAALVLFPVIGHYFSLTQTQFGIWCALAIHDTSSVVGATMQYGAESLQIGTTVKLARALWIVPVTFLFSILTRKKSEHQTSPKKPWFILGFLLMSAIVTWIPSLQNVGHQIEYVARKGLVLALFFIGTNLSWAAIKSIGFRSFAQGFVLWIIVLLVTLFGIKELI